MNSSEIDSTEANQIILRLYEFGSISQNSIDLLSDFVQGYIMYKIKFEDMMKHIEHLQKTEMTHIDKQSEKKIQRVEKKSDNSGNDRLMQVDCQDTNSEYEGTNNRSNENSSDSKISPAKKNLRARINKRMFSYSARKQSEIVIQSVEEKSKNDSFMEVDYGHYESGIETKKNKRNKRMSLPSSSDADSDTSPAEEKSN